MIRNLRAPLAATVAIVVALVVGVRQSTAHPAQALAPPTLKRLATVNGTTAQAVALARTPDGVLHLVFQTFSGSSFSGLGSLSISATGNPGLALPALSGWQTGQPGLVVMPGGTLEAIFGASSPDNTTSVWGITSTAGSWSAPTDVRGGGPNEALAYGSDVTAAMAGSTPVLALPQAGNLVIQTGLGAGAPSVGVTNASDGSTTDADLAVDASTGAVVAAWPSVAQEPALYMQSVVPQLGAVQKVPGQSRNALVLAGRDVGPGVFGAYTSDGKHVRLLRYGGGSLAVGTLPGTTAKVLGAATGPDGRIWVMWGDDAGGGIAVTRSNKAVTAFEPLQRVPAKIGSIFRVSGDGRLGPLDLLVDEIPDGTGPVAPPGLYYARVLPLLSASASVTPLKNGKGVVVAHAFTIVVRDAGDPVAGATVTCGGKSHKTSAAGVSTFTLPGSGHGTASISVAKAGYQPLSETVHF